ncbi:MAG: DNA polymerase/3'-5' exonuclease PolX [Candidatus Omnitrophota bacterium]
MLNEIIAKIFRQIAMILEIKGENTFKIRAYERAAQNIEGIPNLEDIVNEEKLTQIPGIGHDLSEKIKEFVIKGKIQAYEELKKSIPDGLLSLLDIPSVGPKTAKLLFVQLNIKSIPDLEEAIQKGKLKGIFGIKEKTISNILKGIEVVKRGRERLTLSQAAFVADEFISRLKKLPEVKKIASAGSLRRQKETVRDIDILITSKTPKKIMDTFVKLPSVREVLAAGETKASIRTKSDVQVDCRVVEEKSFGAALLYFTGSKDFNIKLRQIAIKKGMKLNEYGLFPAEGGPARGGKNEGEIFKKLGLSYIEPELREDTGEIELALESKLPHLIQLKDILGDLHLHSTWSDGYNSIGELANTAKNLGYSYIAVTDHSQSLKVARGLSIAGLKKKKKEIEKINNTLKGIRVLFGTEVDIDSNGNIDYPNSVLKEFEIVIAAIHSGFKQPKEQLTKRIVKACLNKYVQIIAHPTGLLWGTRDAYDIDFEQILKIAAKTNTHLEINSFPQRLDLNSHNCRLAKEMGIKLAINTDSHTIEQLSAMKFGVAVARRGWLTREDVINTLPIEKLLKAIKK